MQYVENIDGIIVYHTVRHAVICFVAIVPKQTPAGGLKRHSYAPRHATTL